VLSGHRQSVFGPAVIPLFSRYRRAPPFPVRSLVAWRSYCRRTVEMGLLDRIRFAVISPAVVVYRTVIINRGSNNYRTAAQH